MSWSMWKTGPKAEVREFVSKEQCFEQKHGPEGTPNEAQFKAAQASILAVIDSVPDERTVKLEANGHADASGCQYRVNVDTYVPAPGPPDIPRPKDHNPVA